MKCQIQMPRVFKIHRYLWRFSSTFSTLETAGDFVFVVLSLPLPFELLIIRYVFILQKAASSNLSWTKKYHQVEVFQAISNVPMNLLRCIPYHRCIPPDGGRYNQHTTWWLCFCNTCCLEAMGSKVAGSRSLHLSFMNFFEYLEREMWERERERVATCRSIKVLSYLLLPSNNKNSFFEICETRKSKQKNTHLYRFTKCLLFHAALIFASTSGIRYYVSLRVPVAEVEMKAKR